MKMTNDWDHAAVPDPHTKSQNESNHWPDPEPIRNDLRPVAPLQQEMIPEPFRAWIADISHRMQCPIDFVAAAAIVLTSSLIGAGCGIRPKCKDDWLVVPNLWGGVIARPSRLKTPALAEALLPLVRLEATAKVEYDEIMRIFEAEMEMYEAQRKALKEAMVKVARGTGDGERDLKGEYASLKPPERPVWPRFKTNDATS